MVAPEFAFSNSALQASCAASCAVDPAPAISPEALPEPPPLVLELSLLLPQAATPIASRAKAAKIANHLEGLNWISLFCRLGTKQPECMGSRSHSQRPTDSLLSGCIEDVKKM